MECIQKSAFHKFQKKLIYFEPVDAPRSLLHDLFDLYTELWTEQEKWQWIRRRCGVIYEGGRRILIFGP